MSVTHRFRRRSATAAGVLALVATIAACGPGSAAGGGTSSSGKYTLPDDVKAAGVLQVATSLEWPPYDYKSSSGAAVGMDVELATMIAKELGLKVQFTNVTFPSIVPGVANGRFDIGVNEMDDTPVRQQQALMVDYMRSSLSLLVRKGNPNNLSATNLCGRTLAVTQGSSQVQTVAQISSQCTKDGKPAINTVVLQNSGTTVLAVGSGRAQGFLTDAAVGLFDAKAGGANLALAPGVVPGTEAMAGIVVKKSNTVLAKAIQQALQTLVANGQYKSLLTKYGIGRQTLTAITINGSH